MSIIIKKKEKNTYEIKIYEYINIYNMSLLQETIKKIIKKIKKKNKLRKLLVLDIYPSTYETIIILKDYNKLIDITNNTEAKINIHTDTIFLYEIDYPNINIKYKGIVYYYNNKYYLKVKDINKNNYLYLTEYSNIIYEDTDKILDKGLKINI